MQKETQEADVIDVDEEENTGEHSTKLSEGIKEMVAPLSTLKATAEELEQQEIATNKRRRTGANTEAPFREADKP